MKHITLIAIVTVLTLCGCDVKTPEQATTAEQARVIANQENLDNPEIIGQLPDGRPLYAAFVKKSDLGITHTVYWAGNDVTLTQDSKTPITSSTIGPALKDMVILDGQRLDPSEVRQALTRDEDHRRAHESRNHR